jgi:hypothetical protein
VHHSEIGSSTSGSGSFATGSNQQQLQPCPLLLRSLPKTVRS